MTTSIQKDALLSEFAVLAYKDRAFLNNPTNLPSGWQLKDDFAQGPFAAFAFKNETTGEVIIAYRGTDGLSDGIADSKILTGNWDSQFQQGLDFANTVRNNRDLFPQGFDRSKLLVTGHSLGGALAQVAAQAFGLDGSAIDPGAALRIVQTPEFQAAVLALGLPSEGLHAASTFTNYLVAGSTVSGGTGPHIGQTSYVPSLTFNGEQAVTAFLIGFVNPAAGFAYAIGTDQFTNKHSSVQVSQAVQLLAGASDAGTLASGQLKLTFKIIGWQTDNATGEQQPIYSQDEFDIHNAAGELQSTVKFSGTGPDRQFEVFDAQGALQSTTTLSPSGAVTVRPVQGNSIVVAYLPDSTQNSDGTITVTQRAPDGSVLVVRTTQMYEDDSTSETANYPDGRIVRTNRDSDGVVTSRANIVYTDDGHTETITYADGHTVKLTYNANGEFVSQEVVSTGAQTLAQVLNQTGGTLIDALSLLRALQSGQPLPILASGLRLANDVSTLSGASSLQLSGAANAAAGALSILGLQNALQRGDSLAALSAGAQALSFGATAYANFLGYSSSAEASAAAQAFGADSAVAELGDALPAINIVNSLAHQDYVGAAVAAISIVAPEIGIAYTVFNLIGGLFGGDDSPRVPAAWGSGRYLWNDHGTVTYTAAGETGGQEAVAGTLASLLSALNTLIAQEQAQNPGLALGLIPNRLPSLSYSIAGFHFPDIDPSTGNEKYPNLHYDNFGSPYDAPPGSPESFRSLSEAFIYDALARGAIAPSWEVATAQLQTNAGDPLAGLSEVERAARQNQRAAPVVGSTQTFRPIVLDLGNDGIATTPRASSGVGFDVDDSGYLKQTAWINANDAFLTLDRNLNGQIDAGSELFSNAQVALNQRGLAGLRWVDADGNGIIDASDTLSNMPSHGYSNPRRLGLISSQPAYAAH